jgi:CDP-glucose 4,6-dehydratase
MTRATDWPSRRVLVTGATGFIGSWLTRELVRRGAQVVALVCDLDPQSELARSGILRQITVVHGRLEDYATVLRAVNDFETDLIIHLGAQTLVGPAQRSPLATFETNIRGTYHVLEAARVSAPVVRGVVVASSDKAYGASAELPYTESHPLAGRHPYDVSKSCADLLASAYQHSYGVPVAVARCGNVYGGGDPSWSRIIPGTIRALYHGERPVLRSDGSPVRDYLYVEDAVAGYLTLAEQIDRPEVAGQAFNFSAEQPRTVLEVVEAIQQVMGAAHLKPIIAGDGRHEIHSQALSARKAHAVLGWQARHGLAEGLQKTVAWYRALFEHSRFSDASQKRPAREPTS